MALADAVQNGKRPSQTITWTDQDGTAIDLTAATLTGMIRNNRNEGRAIDGTLTVTSGTAGIFRWDYGTADVATAGKFRVQFSAAFGSNPTPQKSIPADWTVHDSIE